MPPAIPLTGLVTEADLKRFWAKTKPMNNKTKCIEWTAASKGGWNDSLYGVFRWDNRNVLAHRFAYYALTGSDPGPSTDHLCHNTLCVNIDHLRGCTAAENNRNRKPVIAEHCKRGHPRTEHNTYIKTDGNRQCRECLRIRDRKRNPERWQARKAKLKQASQRLEGT